MGKKGKAFAHLGCQTTFRPVKDASTQTKPGPDIDPLVTTYQTLATMDKKQIASMLRNMPETCKKIQSAIAMMSSATGLVQPPNPIPNPIIQAPAPLIVHPKAPAPADSAVYSTFKTYKLIRDDWLNSKDRAVVNLHRSFGHAIKWECPASQGQHCSSRVRCAMYEWSQCDKCEVERWFSPAHECLSCRHTLCLRCLTSLHSAK